MTDETRDQVIDAAAALLADGGRSAVTTRAVATRASVPVPTIYRHFQDMDDLLDAVAVRGFEAFQRSKQSVPPKEDPVDDLRQGFDLAVEFGITNAALFSLMYGEPSRAATSAAYQKGIRILRDRVRRLAASGSLAVDEDLAVAIIQASTRGAVLTWLSTPEDRRDPEFWTVSRDALVTAITTTTPATREPGMAAAARAVEANLDTTAVLTPGERHLLTELLARLEQSPG